LDKLPGTILCAALISSFAFAKNDGGTGQQPAPFAGLSLKIQDETVPPNSPYQLQLMVTEPKPVGKGSAGLSVSGPVFGTGAGAAVNDPSGQACGVAVRTADGFQISVLSPNATLGSNGDAAIVTIVVPVRPDAQVGLQVPVNLSNPVFLDASGQPYPLQVSPGTLTIGGTLSITEVIPEGENVAAGSTIAILGTGFTSSVRVDLEGANVVSTRFVSSQEIDVTLDRALLLDGVRMRIRTDTQEVFFFPYLQTTEAGHTSNPLVAAVDPMFSRVTYTSASLAWTTTRTGTTFTGIALQNPGTNPASVTLEVLSSANAVLQTFSFSLPGKTRMTEDLLDFFAQPGASAAAVRISSSPSIQILGMQGDTATGSVNPIVVSSP
jgi:hypothetical protein